MLDEPLPLLLHREKPFGLRGRFLGYKFLSNVVFNGEPVVPKILKEGKIKEGNDEADEFFETEELKGEDLDVFMNRNDVDLKTKMQVMLHITKQLKAIDKHGFVAADRIGSNIRVLQYEGRISTRQMDIAAIYDKVTRAVYSTEYRDSTQSKFDRNEADGCDPWVSDVQELWEIEMRELKKQNLVRAIEILKPNNWSLQKNPKGSNLIEHENTLEKIIKVL